MDWNELAAAILTSSSAKLIKGGIREGEGPEISHVTAVSQRVGGAHLQQEVQPKIPRELDVSWADKDLTHDWPTNPEVRAKSQYFRKRPKPCHKLRNTGNLRCRFVRPDCGPRAGCSGDKRGLSLGEDDEEMGWVKEPNGPNIAYWRRIKRVNKSLSPKTLLKTSGTKQVGPIPIQEC